MGGSRISQSGRKPRGGGAKLLLPPANEVWGKVMFLHLSVSHSVHLFVIIFADNCLKILKIGLSPFRPTPIRHWKHSYDTKLR